MYGLQALGKKNNCERARASSFRFLYKVPYCVCFFLFQYVTLVLVPVGFLFVFAFHFSVLESIPRAQCQESKPEENEDEGTIT